MFALAAAYACGIINHPFIDDNTRTRFLAAFVFLGVNGVEFSAEQPDVVVQTFAVAAGELIGRESRTLLTILEPLLHSRMPGTTDRE